jgi:WD40 repeat protein
VSGSGELYPRADGYGWGWYDNSVRLWSVPGGVELKRFDGHRDLVTCVAFSPDGSTVASGSRDTTVRIWCAVSGRNLATLSGLGEAVTKVGFDPCGNEVFARSSHGYIRWRAKDWQETEKIKSDMLETLFYANGDNEPWFSYSEPLELIERDAPDGRAIFGTRANHLTVLHLTKF